MIRLKKTISELKSGPYLITRDTSEDRIKHIINKKPQLKVYFDGFKKSKSDDKNENSKD